MMSIIVWLLVMIWIGVWVPLLLNIVREMRPAPVEAPPAPSLGFEVPDDALLETARTLTGTWEPHQSSGEHKRHQVLAALKKSFPNRSEREMARAIEAALWP